MKIAIENKAALVKIGDHLKSKYSQYQTDRKPLEEQWIKNLRQYRGKYDPEVLANIPEGRSRVYPKETHTKVIGFVAKLMEMMFPASDKNWSVDATPVPSISQDDLQSIMDKLTQQSQVEMQAAQQEPAQPGTAPASPTEVTSDMIEREVISFAKDRARKMEREIEDQLADLGGDQVTYEQLCKKVLRSGGIYGYGIAKGPMTQYKTERKWEKDPTSGQFKAVTKDIPRPMYEHVKVWDLFPDLTARGWRKQDGVFERLVMNRHEVVKIKSNKDFYEDVVAAFLQDNRTGNYTPNNADTQLNALNKAEGVSTSSKNKFEVVRWLGYLDGQDMLDAGVEGVKEADAASDIFAEVWMLGDKVIRIDIAPFGENPADNYHCFIFDEDEDSGLTGTGLPEVLRDSQMRLCSIDRATQDNMAACAGPVYEINRELLSPGQKINAIRAFQVIYRDGTGTESGSRAINAITTDSHISELISLRKEVLDTFDRESSLPAWLFGSTEGLGEAFRTSNNMSMMTGGANMVQKDVVRAFDLFTASVIGSVVAWNMEFNENVEIKGDFNVGARGNKSLVAKEVRGAALDQFMTTLTEDERAIFKTRDTLIERLRSRDLPTELLEDDVTARKILDQRAQAAQAQQQLADRHLTAQAGKLEAGATKDIETVKLAASQNQAKIAEILSRVEQNLANVEDQSSRTELEHIKTLLEGLSRTQELENGRQGQGKGADSSASGKGEAQ